MMRGKTNTSVFPDPVKAIPIMSLPDSLYTKSNTISESIIMYYELNIDITVLHTLPVFLEFVLG